MQNLKEIWSVLSKMTWRICQFFIHRLKNGDFILERNILIKKKIQKTQIGQMQHENNTLEINE